MIFQVMKGVLSPWYMSSDHCGSRVPLAQKGKRPDQVTLVIFCGLWSFS